MTILHKECLATDLALPANRTVIAATFVDGTATAHVSGAAIYTVAQADTLLATKAPSFSVQEEGAVVQAAPTAINFVGTGVTATTVGTVATVTLASTAVPVQEEGVTVTAAPTAINFVGTGVTATNTAGVATVNIPKITSFVFNAAGDGSAVITYSDSTTVIVAAIPAPAVC
jgi:hypothetical protein